MWIYDDNEIYSQADLFLHNKVNIQNFEGFVYKIVDVELDKIYIGKKVFWFRRKKRLGKRELAAMQDRRRSKTKLIVSESDWITYTGSNKELNERIKDGAQITKEILRLCETKALMTYYETKFQFSEEVLEIDSYCDNINGKYYRKIFDKIDKNG